MSAITSTATGNSLARFYINALLTATVAKDVFVSLRSFPPLRPLLGFSVDHAHHTARHVKVAMCVLDAISRLHAHNRGGPQSRYSDRQDFFRFQAATCRA